MKTFGLLFLFIIFTIQLFSQKDTLYLWPETVPGQTEEKAPAVVSDNRTKNVTRLAKVTNPLLVAFQSEGPSRGCMIVCPGGGYVHMAVDMEGYEVANWLREQGFTAYVLQYRVPNNREGALQDAQRAIRMVRHLHPDLQIGIMGFSAGGSLSARTATLSTVQSYPAEDETDTLSALPDFAALIYPAYLDQGENRSLTPELTIDELTPPMFIFGTADDKYGNSALVMTTAMRDKNRPVELHFLSEGGHGYGIREGNIAAETWPALLSKWMSKQGL